MYDGHDAQQVAERAIEAEQFLLARISLKTPPGGDYLDFRDLPTLQKTVKCIDDVVRHHQCQLVPVFRTRAGEAIALPIVDATVCEGQLSLPDLQVDLGSLAGALIKNASEIAAMGRINVDAMSRLDRKRAVAMVALSKALNSDCVRLQLPGTNGGDLSLDNLAKVDLFTSEQECSVIGRVMLVNKPARRVHLDSDVVVENVDCDFDKIKVGEQVQFFVSRTGHFLKTEVVQFKTLVSDKQAGLFNGSEA